MYILIDDVMMHDVRYIDDDNNTQKGSVHGKGLCIVSCIIGQFVEVYIPVT